MTTLNIRLFCGVLLILLFAACNKEDKLTSADLTDIAGEVWIPTNFDNWVNANYVKPYNVEVRYRWDQYDVNLRKSAVPADTAKAAALLRTLQATQFKPYGSVGGEKFLKRYLPRLFVLVGSYEWNSNGTITLGFAEGGNKIVFTGVNNFDLNNRAETERLIRTSLHEFAHILHQNIYLPSSYQLISKGNYSASWQNLSLANAYELGFISQYARANADEDFVEMISFMQTMGKDGYEAWLTARPATAQDALRKKETLVVQYFKDAYNIDFYQLRDSTYANINQYLNQ